MNRDQVERSRRFQISRRGILRYEDHRFACLIQDISEKGMFLICNYDLEIGLKLDVEFELEPGSGFSGRIKVKHFNDGCFGAELVEADDESQRNWDQFLRRHYSGQPKLAERRTRL